MLREPPHEWRRRERGRGVREELRESRRQARRRISSRSREAARVREDQAAVRLVPRQHRCVPRREVLHVLGHERPTVERRDNEQFGVAQSPEFGELSRRAYVVPIGAQDLCHRRIVHLVE